MRVYVFYIYTNNRNRVSISHTLQWIACVKLQQEAYVRTQPTCSLQNLRLADTYASLSQVVSASSVDMPGVGCKCTTFPSTDLRIFRVKLSFRNFPEIWNRTENYPFLSYCEIYFKKFVLFCPFANTKMYSTMLWSGRYRSLPRALFTDPLTSSRAATLGRTPAWEAGDKMVVDGSIECDVFACILINA